MKLELKHLAAYLPYGLNCNAYANDWDISETYQRMFRIETGGTKKNPENVEPFIIVGDSECTLDIVQPILRPLSDLSKTFEHQQRALKINVIDIIFERSFGFAPNEEFGYRGIVKGADGDHYSFHFKKGRAMAMMPCDPKQMTFEDVQLLHEFHFDTFGLIDAGLAIDINTLP